MNKGLEIRNRKLQRKKRKMFTIKAEQRELIRFVSFKEEIIEKVNGKYRHTGQTKDNGLQVENRIITNKGDTKLVNRNTLRITEIYDDVPEWANENLIEKYKILREEYERY